MKKAIVMVLAVLMVISMASFGYAAGIASPGAIWKPSIIVDPDDEKSLGDLLLDAKEVGELLVQEKQDVYKEAYESLKDMDAVLKSLSEESIAQIQTVLGDETLTAEALTPKYLYYFLPADPSTCPKDVKLDFEGMIESLDFEQCVFMQYADGQWVVNEIVIVEESIITVKGMVEGPLCILTL